MAMTGQDWLAYWQAKGGGEDEKRKADWLDLAGTGLGAGAGLVLGGPAGAMAGAQLGGAIGGTAENAVNHTLTPGSLLSGAQQAVGGYGGMTDAMDVAGGKSLVQQLADAGFFQNFAVGGPVDPSNPLWQQAAMGPAQAPAAQGPAIGSPQDVMEFMRGIEDGMASLPGAAPFAPEPVKHPTLEMLASVVPQVAAALPAPRQTKSVNKTIGAWAPALATAFSAPINYSKAQREDRNKRGSDAAKALADHRWAIAKELTSRVGVGGQRPVTEKQPPRQFTLDDGTVVDMTPGVQALLTRKSLGMDARSVAGAAKQPVVEMTPQALDRASWEFATTGIMPTFGRGSSGDNQRNMVRNRTAELFPGINIGENRATFSANRASLTGLQKMYDAVVSFEQTAIKNADAADEAMRAVKDFGSKWANRPVRDVLNASGNPEVAGLRTAIATIQPEFARILSNPTLAGQLTDTSRREMQEIIDGNATLAQFRKTVYYLKRDAANRRTSLEGQIGVVRERIRLRGGASDEPAREWKDF